MYVYEPSKELYDIAKENIKNHPNVFLHNFGLGSSTRTEALKILGRPTHEVIELRNAVDVLNDIMKAEGEIGLVKIDCEGCEWEIAPFVASLEKLSAVYVEIHGCHHEALLSEFRQHGFNLKVAKTLPWARSVSMYLLEKTNSQICELKSR